MTGRLSEEHAKTAFSSALKAVIEQEQEQEQGQGQDDNWNKSDSNSGVHPSSVAHFAASSSSSSSSLTVVAAFQALAYSLIAVRLA